MSDAPSGPGTGGWQRLDPRMLLVHPVRELIRFLPALFGIVLVDQGGDTRWDLIGVAAVVALGLSRYATTTYRIGDGQIQLRQGLLQRTTLTARLDRVRTVELTSSPIHRLLGLAKVAIGTGSAARRAEGGIALDALASARARALRGELLHRVSVTADSTDAPVEAPADDVLLRLDPTWVRYAPLTTSGIVTFAGLMGIASQSAHSITRAVGSRVFDDLARVSAVVLVPVAIVLLIVVVSLLSMAGYLVKSWGFTLSRDRAGRSFHVRRGMFTSRETSVDADRMRGVEMHEPFGLRLAGAARLQAIVVGLKRREEGSSPLSPAAPRHVVERTGAAVLGDRTPFEAPLVAHGPRARRRRFTRAFTVTGVLSAALLVLVRQTGMSTWWLIACPIMLTAAALLARDRYRRLGHATVGRWLITRAHTFRGRRDALEAAGVIGWTLHQSYFQRRAGLCTLTATTAAGKQAYHVYDVPETTAVEITRHVTSDLLDAFVG